VIDGVTLACLADCWASSLSPPLVAWSRWRVPQIHSGGPTVGAEPLVQKSRFLRVVYLGKPAVITDPRYGKQYVEMPNLQRMQHLPSLNKHLLPLDKAAWVDAPSHE